MHTADFLVIGAGIAGASLAWHLAPHGRVVVVEREPQPGYHSTGRSAAIYTECYGPRTMRLMTRASGAFLRDPPAGFADAPLLTPLGVLFVADHARTARFAARLAELQEIAPQVREVDRREALRRCPVLDPDALAAAALDPHAMNMDVHALHQGYLRAARAAGASLFTDVSLRAIERRAGTWHLDAGDLRFSAPVLVDAAGAWSDEVARMAGVAPLGLVPKRRTAVLFDAPPGSDASTWSAVWDVDDRWYFKPEGRQVLATPGDETPVAPHDVQPEEMDVALAVHRIEQATRLRPRRIHRAWAGLRSFVADGDPVVGFDPEAAGFFWLAGQGGYGIKTSWAMGLAATSLIVDGRLAPRLVDVGLDAARLGPHRLLSAA